MLELWFNVKCFSLTTIVETEVNVKRMLSMIVVAMVLVYKVVVAMVLVSMVVVAMIVMG
jgi:hypothetical protein